MTELVNRKNPESSWTGRTLSGDDSASYEITIRTSRYDYQGSISDSDWKPDGSWTWKVEKKDITPSLILMVQYKLILMVRQNSKM